MSLSRSELPRSNDPRGSAQALDDAIYVDLPLGAEQALRDAGRCYGDAAQAEQHLARARRLAPGHLAVAVAEYRYHFYRHDYVRAARHGEECLRLIADRLGIAHDFSEVRAEHAEFGGDVRAARLWLLALQAYGYVLLRLGERERAFAALSKVSELDAADRTKTRVLIEVITRAERDD
jgi:tetratricopeptide (TPR) repeat protein